MSDEQSEYEINCEKAQELYYLKDQIKDLLNEAESILSGTREENRAKSYWIAHLKMALDNDHGYFGGSMVTMQNTIDDLQEDEEGEEE